MNEPQPPNSGKSKRKLAESPKMAKHVEQLAKKIMDDPTFPLLHETARKLHDKEPGGE